MTRSNTVGSIAGIVLLLAGAESLVSAQSLGDVARREAERRQQVTSGRVYTNEDLAPVDPAQTTATPSAAAVTPAADNAQPADGKKAEGTGAAAGAEGGKPAATPRVKRDEPYWRGRAKDLRGRLARVEADAATADARLNEIDAAPPSPVVAREREVVATALVRLQASVRYLRDEVAQFEKFAAFNKVPPDWIR